MELNSVEKLAVAQAIQNAIGDLVKTKNPDNLRGEVDALMIERYESDPMGAKSFDVKLFGQKVGTYSLTVSKPKPQSEHVEITVNDEAEFRRWCEREGFMTIDMGAVERYFADTGDMPYGCDARTVIEPEIMGGQVTRTTLKVAPAEVARILGDKALGEYTAKLLGGGEVD